MRNKLSLEEISKRSSLIHVDEENIPLYFIPLEQEYKNVNKTQLKIYCKECDEWFNMNAKNHLTLKQGHKKCAIQKRRLTMKEISDRSEGIFRDKDGNTLYFIPLDQEYENGYTEIKIFCKRCDKWIKQRADNHLAGHGCNDCGERENAKNRLLTLKEISDRSNAIHTDENGETMYIIDLDQKYINKRHEIDIFCKKCKETFKQTVSVHLQGCGCSCFTESKGERFISKFLNTLGISYIKQYKFKECKNIKRLPFDFYLEKYNTCIEYDGRQHFEPIEYFGGQSNFDKSIHNDNIKNKYCEDKGIKLLRIKYNENIEEKILSFLDNITL